jgi:hypothetical protein
MTFIYPTNPTIFLHEGQLHHRRKAENPGQFTLCSISGFGRMHADLEYAKMALWIALSRNHHSLLLMQCIYWTDTMHLMQ